MTRKKKNEVAKSPQNSSEWHALLEREGLLLLLELIFVTPCSQTQCYQTIQKFPTNISKFDKYEFSALGTHICHPYSHWESQTKCYQTIKKLSTNISEYDKYEVLQNNFLQKFSTNISKYNKYEFSACLTSTVAGRDPLRQSTSSLISSIVNFRLLCHWNTS